MNLRSIAIQYWHHHNKRTIFPHYDGSLYCSCPEGLRIKENAKNWKGSIMIDEGGEIKVKEERDLTGIPLSGPGQKMETDTYLNKFSEFINSTNPAELMKSLFCSIPEKMFLDMNADEQLDFIHKLDSCVLTLKVYQQSAEVNHRNKVESLELEEQVKLKKKDREFRAAPALKDSAKKDELTKQQKFVKMLRDTGMSEEQILVIVHGNKG